MVVNFQYFYDDETPNNIALLPNLFTPVSLEKTDHVSPGIFLRDIAHTCITARLENPLFRITSVSNDKSPRLFKFNIHTHWWYFFNFLCLDTFMTLM